MKLLRPLSRHNRAFTLIELITVVSIIVVLFSLVVGGFSYADRSSKRSRTEVTMRSARGGLELYREKFGAYPTYEAGRASQMISIAKRDFPVAGGACLYQALSGDGYDFIFMGGDKPNTPPNSDGRVDAGEAPNVVLVNMPKEITAKSGDTYFLVDGFGQPFRYMRSRRYDATGTLFDSPDNRNSYDTVNRNTYDLWSITDDNAETSLRMSSVEGRTTKADQRWITNW